MHRHYSGMSFIGTVAEDGKITLPPGAKLPAGTQVRIVPVEETDVRPIGRKLLDLAGVVKDWPADLAENHDHYLHGTPKRPRS